MTDRIRTATWGWWKRPRFRHPLSSAPQAHPPSAEVRFWRRLALAAVALHFLLALLFSALIPPWEAHDEWAHYKYVEYVARYGRLPPQDRRLTTEYTYDEATQPPLYYVLAAIPVRLAVPKDGYRPTVNPYATRGDGAGGVNMAIHDPKVEGFPWRGTILALHLARLASVLIGTVGLWWTWRLGRLLAPEDPAVAGLAVAFHALIPQYVFIGSVVTNDILLAVLTAAVWCGLVDVLRPPPRVSATLYLGVMLVLAILTKYLALALVLPGLVVPTVAWGRGVRGWRRWIAPVLVALVVLVGGGAWMYRNVQQTGMLLPRDPYAIAQVTARSPWELVRTLPWHHVPGALRYGFRTLWASFGWGNVDPGVWVTYVFGALCGLGLVGWGWRAYRRRLSRWEIAVLGVFIGTALAMIALPLLRELVHRGSILRGRYVLGLLPAVSVWAAAGWLAWLPTRVRPYAGVALLGGLTALNLYCLFGVILPVYRPPAPLTPAEVEAWLNRPGVQLVRARFGDAIDLVAVRPRTENVAAGERAVVEVLWRTRRALSQNYTLGIQVLGRRRKSYGWLNIFPGRGTYPSTLWQPDVWFTETYWVPVYPTHPLPTGGVWSFYFFLDEPGYPTLPVYDAQGRIIPGVFVGRLRLSPSQDVRLPRPRPLCSVGARWDAGLYLSGVTWGSSESASAPLPLVLHWRAWTTPSQDWTVFIHILDAKGTYVAGGDSPPQEGDFPTGLWRAGDVVLDPRQVPLPAALTPGRYAVTVGLYRPDTGVRARLLQAPVDPPPEPDAVTVAVLRVVPDRSFQLECPYVSEGG